MTTELVKKLVENHNNQVDNFINHELPKLLGVKEGEKVNVEMWFKAQELIGAQKFYQRGMAILKPCRECGFAVKMDMQSNKLVF